MWFWLSVFVLNVAGWKQYTCAFLRRICASTSKNLCAVISLCQNDAPRKQASKQASLFFTCAKHWGICAACFRFACCLLAICLLPACCLHAACLLPACCLLAACLLLASCLLAACLLFACCLLAACLLLVR